MVDDEEESAAVVPSWYPHMQEESIAPNRERGERGEPRTDRFVIIVLLMMTMLGWLAHLWR